VSPFADAGASLVSPGSDVDEELLAALVETAGNEIESCECELLRLSVRAGLLRGRARGAWWQ
jgi:hypothetical protein